MDRSLRERFRFFLKDTIRQTIDFSMTEQSMGVEAPPIEKPAPQDAERFTLVPAGELRSLAAVDVYSAISNRRSRRSFSREPLSLRELSFLLWATQGVRMVAGPGTAFRTVPSAGCRHALETYLCIFDVTGLEQGIYRYLPLAHQLILVSRPAHLRTLIVQAAFGQEFIGNASAVFIWTTIPGRMEWRYDAAAHKVIALDAGHVCQNLYTACEAIHAGTCAVAAYHQEFMDALLGIDGDDEFTIYLAPVGKRKAEEDLL